MSRVYNFSAGPAVLPEEVLKEAADEMLDYRGTGMSVMEMSHRSKAFEEIITTAEQGPGSWSAGCDDPDEPDEEPGCGLYHHGTVGEKSGERS